MTKRIVIRADASKQIGAGHVMRCLALADELRQRGAEVTFVAREMLPVLAQRIRDAGHALHLLPPPRNPGRNHGFTYAHWLSEEAETDARQTLDVMRNLGRVDWLVVDHYGIDARWERIAREGAERLMVIDDMADRPHHCDLLLDQTPRRTATTYAGLLPKDCQVFCGAEYALLRKSIRNFRINSLKRREKFKEIKNIIIYFGKDSITEKIVTSLYNDTSLLNILENVIILGSAKKSDTEKFKFLKYQSKLESLYIDSDIAIGGGGVSALERACLGIPQILYSVSKNQEKVIEGLSRQGAALHLQTLSPKEIKERINLISEKGTYKRMAESGASTVRGCGAQIASIYMLPKKSKDGNKIWLKPFEIEDMEYLLELQRKKGVRKYFFNPNPPTKQEHIMWFNRFIKDPYKIGWIIMLEEKKVGMIRAELLLSDEYEISILIDPTHQAKGIGKEALLYITNHILMENNIIAKININNTNSIILFEKVGFKKKEEMGSFLKYEKTHKPY